MPDLMISLSAPIKTAPERRTVPFSSPGTGKSGQSPIILLDALGISQAAANIRHESVVMSRILIGAALAVVGVLIVAPVALVFYLALGHGIGAYWHNLVGDSATLHAIKLTLIVAPISVALNTVFGVAAAWLIRGSGFQVARRW